MEAFLYKVVFHGNVILLFAEYIPPGFSIVLLDDLKAVLMQNIRPSVNFILAGGFNLPNIDWETIEAGDCERVIGDVFIDQVFSLNLVQVLKEITRTQGASQSLLDLILL